MTWQVKKQHLDKRLGMVIIHLHEPDSGAEHKLQICVGADSCAMCGALHPKTNLGEIDVRAILESCIDRLNKDHAAQDAYAKKYGIPQRKRG